MSPLDTLTHSPASEGPVWITDERIDNTIEALLGEVTWEPVGRRECWYELGTQFFEELALPEEIGFMMLSSMARFMEVGEYYGAQPVMTLELVAKYADEVCALALEDEWGGTFRRM